MAIVDLSTTIEPHFRWPSYSFVSQAYADGDEFQEFGLRWLGNGFSHVTAPAWKRPRGQKLDDFPLHRFLGPARVVDLGRLGDGALIDAAMLERRCEAPGDPILLLRTGFAKRVSWRWKDYFARCPRIAADVAPWLARRGVGLLAIDFPCEEPYALGDGSFRDRLDAEGVLLVQNCRNLEELRQERVLFAALPLRLPGATASPVRPIAFTDWPSGAPEIFDVSMPLTNHWRWRLDVWEGRTHERDGCAETHFCFGGHGFTHCDAPRHMERDGAAMQELPFERWMHEAALVDLADLPLPTPLTEELLETRTRHVRPGDIVVLRSDLTNRLGYDSREWHLKAPNLTVKGARHLVGLEPTAIALDFPQDFVAREMPMRFVANEEFVAHHSVLRHGIPFIEDLRDLGEIGSDRFFLMAVPLKMPNLDGAPMRVVALRW